MEKIVLVKVKIEPAAINQFLELTNTMVAESNLEDGCQMYQVFRNTDSESEFLVYEKYESNEAIEVHNSSDHFKYFMGAVTPLLIAEPEIDIR